MVDVFLEGISTTAQQSKRTLDFLYADPIISINQLQQHLGLKYNATNKLVKDLAHLKILQETTGQNRNHLFVMHEYLSLFEVG